MQHSSAIKTSKGALLGFDPTCQALSDIAARRVRCETYRSLVHLTSHIPHRLLTTRHPTGYRTVRHAQQVIQVAEPALEQKDETQKVELSIHPRSIPWIIRQDLLDLVVLLP